MLDIEFSRHRFVEDSDPQERCHRLAEVFTARLRAAANSLQAVEWILAELRERGHEVARWYEVISDVWQRPDSDRYLWVVLARAARTEVSDGDDDDDDEPRWSGVSVAYRPRLRDLPKRCPQCFSEMTLCDVRLRVEGHGSATAPAVRVRFNAPGIPPMDRLVANERLDVFRNGLQCASCGAAWLPPPPP